MGKYHYRRKYYGQLNLNKILYFYNKKHISLSKLCKIFKCSRRLIIRLFNDNGIHIKTLSEILKGRRSTFKDSHHTKKAKKLMSVAKKGKELSLSHRENLRKANIGEGNPFFGKTHSKKSRRLMSINHRDVTGKNNPMSNSETRKNVSKSLTGLKRSLKSRENISKAISELYLNNWSTISKHKHGFFKTLKYSKGKIFYRSSYELELLKQLERNLNVKMIYPESIRIKYRYSNFNHYTVPDFKVITKKFKYLIEVKPISKLNDVIQKIKIKAMKSYANENKMKFIIMTEKEIFKEKQGFKLS